MRLLSGITRARFPLITAWLALVVLEGLLLVTSEHPVPTMLASAVAWLGGCFSVRLYDAEVESRK